VEETWEFAVVSECGIQLLNEWYPNASKGMKQDIVTHFSAESLNVGSLLNDCVHSQFGYEGIPLLANFDEQPLLENALLTLDIIQLFYCSIQFETALYSMAGLLDKESQNKAEFNVIKSYFSISARMNREVAAIRLLIVSDLAVQAIGRSRSYYECYNALLLSAFDTAFANDFVIATNPSETKHLFFKYFSKSKAEKKIKKHLIATGGGAESIERLEKLSEEFIAEFGSAVHPSFYSTIDTMFQDMEEVTKFDGFRLRSGAIGVAQRFSMLAAGHLLILIIEFYQRIIIPLIEQLKISTPQTEETASIRDFAKKSRTSLLLLPLSLARHSIVETS